MKVAPVYHELQHHDWCRVKLVHTGQHYDFNMSAAFWRDLGLPQPDLHLGVGSGTHGRQTGTCLIAYEEVLLQEPPDWVIVVGDVNSTLACTLAAHKLSIKVAHLEAGLRSFDRTMPEETNRILTDAMADLLWTPSEDAEENLRREGIPVHRIELVGNIMIDSLEMLRAKIEGLTVWRDLGLTPQGYGVATIHRPANVDRSEVLESIVTALLKMSKKIHIVFPVHPRTRERLARFGLLERLSAAPGLIILEPMSYLSFMNLVFNCKLVITDSGGIQEETTYLDIPCLTLRENTERPITITQGTNRLQRVEQLENGVDQIMRGEWPKGLRPPLWDGATASRVALSLRKSAFSS